MRGGGGAGVRELRAGAHVGASELAQERIEGQLGSVSFVADGDVTDATVDTGGGDSTIDGGLGVI